MKMNKIICYILLSLFICGCPPMTDIQKEKAVDFAIEVGMLAIKVIAAFPPDQIIGLRSIHYDRVLLYPKKEIAVYISDGVVKKIESLDEYKGARN